MADHPDFAKRDLSSVRGGTMLQALPPDRRPSEAGLTPDLLSMTETGSLTDGRGARHPRCPRSCTAPSEFRYLVWCSTGSSTPHQAARTPAEGSE